jgi:hypothetical protein
MAQRIEQAASLQGAQWVMDKRAKVTGLVLEHVERADDALKIFCNDGVTADGILTHPLFQTAALKVGTIEGNPG